MKQLRLNFYRDISLYFSVAPNTDELKAISIAKPDNILLSFALWRRKSVADFIEAVGYTPKSILLDSGAFTFHNKRVSNGLWDLIQCYTANDDEGEMTEADIARDIQEAIHRYGFYNPGDAGGPLPIQPFLEFYFYWEKNYQLIDYVITMDTIGSPLMTEWGYKILDAMGMCPLPVFGYGQDERGLSELVASGADYIALGGTAFIKEKKERVRWARDIITRYPGVRFHLLGTQDRYILDRLPGLHSADGTAWLTTASFKRDRRPGEGKVDAAVANIRRMAGRCL